MTHDTQQASRGVGLSDPCASYQLPPQASYASYASKQVSRQPSRQPSLTASHVFGAFSQSSSALAVFSSPAAPRVIWRNWGREDIYIWSGGENYMFEKNV